MGIIIIGLYNITSWTQLYPPLEVKLDVKIYLNGYKYMIGWIFVTPLQWFGHLKILGLSHLSTSHVSPEDFDISRSDLWIPWIVWNLGSTVDNVFASSHMGIFRVDIAWCAVLDENDILFLYLLLIFFCDINTLKELFHALYFFELPVLL